MTVSTRALGGLADDATPTAGSNQVGNSLEQFKCQSYYDEDNELQDCTCGKCEPRCSYCGGWGGDNGYPCPDCHREMIR